VSVELLERVRVAIETAAEQVDGLHNGEAAMEQLDEALALVQKLAPEQLQLPLWDDRVQVDAEAGIAWRYVGGHKVVVSLEDADLLADANGSVGTGPKNVSLRVGTEVGTTTEDRTVYVRRGTKPLGPLVLNRTAGPPPTPGHTCDHYPDTSQLNNTRGNLRWATKPEQSNNRRVWGKSRFLRVTWDSKTGRWRWVLHAAGKMHSGPLNDDEIATARAADAAAIRLIGPHARTNVSIGKLPPLEQLELAV
jgi:hypothetical protein